MLTTELHGLIHAHAASDTQRKHLYTLAKTGRWRDDQWLSRNVRDAFTGKNPHPQTGQGVVADNLSYDTCRDEHGHLWLAVMGLQPRQRIRINLGALPEQLVPTSTITIRRDNDRWHVTAAYHPHTVCSTRPQHRHPAPVDGIDAGVREVCTTTSGQVFGDKQYQQIATRAQRDTDRGRARNKLRAVAYNHQAKAEHARQRGDTTTARKHTATARRIACHNLGHTKMSAQRRRDRAATKDAAYQAIHDLVDTTSRIIAEDLSGMRGKSKFGRNVNRVYSAWQRSFLADALASVPGRRGSAVTLVNPAYTSQQVHSCGHLGVRKGKKVHCQTAGCPQQGIVYDTEINAARVIMSRATDPDITLYTPHNTVKKILMSRAGTVENCPTTTQAAESGGCERNNEPHEQQCSRSK